MTSCLTHRTTRTESLDTELRILGLADLGPKQQSYDDCYREDKDNYIDVVLAGQVAAARRITGV